MSHLPKKVIYVDEESLFSNLIGKTEYNIEYNKNGRIEKISALHGYSKFALTYEGNLLKKLQILNIITWKKKLTQLQVTTTT